MNNRPLVSILVRTLTFTAAFFSAAVSLLLFLFLHYFLCSLFFTPAVFGARWFYADYAQLCLFYGKFSHFQHSEESVLGISI